MAYGADKPIFRGTQSDCTKTVRRTGRFAPLVVVAALAGAGIFGGLIGTGLGIYSAIEIAKIKDIQGKVAEHINAIQDTVTADHDDLVKLEFLTHSLYEYTHKEFRELAENLSKANCIEGANEQAILQVLDSVKMKTKLYTDMSSVVSSIFSNRPSPIVLPDRTILALMRSRPEWFRDTVYWDQLSLVYQYGSVSPVHPITPKAIGYILQHTETVTLSTLVNY